MTFRMRNTEFDSDRATFMNAQHNSSLMMEVYKTEDNTTSKKRSRNQVQVDFVVNLPVLK